jgi:hypothetical protein
MNKMHAAIARIENEHLAKAMMKQVVYHQVIQTMISKEQISVSSFSQSSDYDKLIAEQKEVMLMKKQLKRMN